MTASAPQPNAGWYPDPEMAGTQRYWDGGEWSDHVAPLGQVQPAENPADVFIDRESLNWGHWVAVLLIPLLGLIWGVLQLGRNPRIGAQLLGIALLGVVLYWLVLGVLAESRY